MYTHQLRAARISQLNAAGALIFLHARTHTACGHWIIQHQVGEYGMGIGCTYGSQPQEAQSGPTEGHERPPYDHHAWSQTLVGEQHEPAVTGSF